MAAPRKVDYEAIEPGWRAGILSPNQLAEEYTKATGVSVSRVSIIKHFAKLDIPRDLTAKIQAQADKMVADAMVTNMATDATLRDKELTEKEIISGVATTQSTIRTEQNTNATANRHMLEKMIAELAGQNDYQEDLAKLGELMVTDETLGRLKDVYNKVISMPGRVDSAKKLMEAWAKIVDVERRVYGIADKVVSVEETPLEELVAKARYLSKKLNIGE